MGSSKSNCPNTAVAEFTVIVKDCFYSACNISDPFTELTWLNGLIEQEGYYEFINLYHYEQNEYIEVFSE